MRTIKHVADATPFNVNQNNIRLFRAIGSVDIDGQGVQHDIAEIDPFIFLDEAFIEGEVSSSFRKHPHTGLTAVTYLLEGVSHAWDNLHGATPDLNHAGGVYCIDAGKGIVHGEAPVEGERNVRLLQLWYNPGIYDSQLPSARYQLFQPNELPIYEDQQIWAKVIIGNAFGLTSPVSTRWPIQYVHLKVAPHQTHLIKIQDATWHGFIYVIRGKGKFGENKTIGEPQQCMILGLEKAVSIRVTNTSSEVLEFIFATGKPHHKKFIKLLGHGGAVVTDTEKKARAFMQDYENNSEDFGR
jgi:redox-sensitive bicupin YhaK (pirin superfamily)